jgi:hypothetical protein
MLEGWALTPKARYPQAVETRRRHRVTLAENPQWPVQPSALLKMHKEVGHVAQRSIDAGAVLQAKIPHAGEAAVLNAASLGNPLRHGSIVGVDDKLDLNGSG